MRHPVPVILVLWVSAVVAAPGGEPLESSTREEVTVRRVQVDMVVLPRGGDVAACRELEPGELVARVGGEEWTVEAIDWGEAGSRERRSLTVEEGCLQLAVYLGQFAPWVPMDCPWIPMMRLQAPFEPPSRDIHASYDHDVYLAARRLVEGMRACDRVSFWMGGHSVMRHSRWVRGPDMGLAVLDAMVGARRAAPEVQRLILEQPWRDGWPRIVAALGAVRGWKDLVVIDARDAVFYRGTDPWRIAGLAEAARRARVTIHQVDPVAEGRVRVPDSAKAVATGGLVVRGGARARVTEEIRRRAYCRARLTLVPPPGARRERYRLVSVEDRRGRFDLVGTSWLVEGEEDEESRLADYLGAGEGNLYLEVKLEGVEDCGETGEGRWQRCVARVVVRPNGVVPVEPGAAGIVSWNRERTEFSHVYGLEAGGPLRGVRRIRLPFRARPGQRTVCVMVFDREGTFLGSACGSERIPPSASRAVASAAP